jgi:hypothetical protein
MAITAAQIKITYRYTWLGQLCQNVMYWAPQGAAFLTADMIQVLEAYWNDLQPTLAPLMPSASTIGTFNSLLGEEIGGGAQFAEYPIPPLEQVGTRAALNSANISASFLALGIRLTVGTRVTRPGQKRFPWLGETDIALNAIDPTIITLYQPLAEHFSGPRVLGAPVALGALQPVVGGTEVSGVPTVWQDVTGYVINPNATSQVSRKVGRGS